MSSAVIFVSDYFPCTSLTEVRNVTGAGQLEHCGMGYEVQVEPFNCQGNENTTEFYSESRLYSANITREIFISDFVEFL